MKKDLKRNVQPLEDFDWSLYEDGWNGKTLKRNSKIKSKNSEIVYCHEKYALDAYNKYGNNPFASKDSGGIVYITDVKRIDNHNILATVNGGANDIVINLDKETKFLEMISPNPDDSNITEYISNNLDNEIFKKEFLNLKIPVEISETCDRGSIWSGYTKNIENEMKKDVKEQKNAYYAQIIDSNNGGFIVEISGAVKAFMPTSMAASNKILDMESMIGKVMLVMIEAWNPKIGFIVSRKKYIKRIMPNALANLAEEFKINPDKLYQGTVTGFTAFGVFVELDEILTGMIHKTLISDELKQAMQKGAIKPGTVLNVYIHDISNQRIILSDVPRVERDAVIAIREKEDHFKKPVKKKNIEEIE